MGNLRTGRKPGRPRKPDAEKRRPRFGVWVTDVEAEEIRRKANAVGLPPAVFLRRVALSKPIRPRPAIPAVNRDTYLELGTFAGALNQLIRAFNRDEGVDGITLDFLEQGMSLAREVREKLMGVGLPEARESDQEE